jgi:membrane-bound serine protease (ClpP class)
MNKSLTYTRLILAIFSTALEETAIWAIWTRVLPGFGVHLSVALLVVVMVAWGGFSTALFVFTTRVLRKQVEVGTSSMVGMIGEAVRALDPNGQVKIKGELWQAVSAEGKIEVGEEIEVVKQSGLKLSVRCIESARH